MPEFAPDDANAIIRQQLDDRVGELETSFKADVLAFWGRLTFGADAVIRDAVEWRKQQKPTRPKLVFFLGTDGGYAEVVQRIVKVLRRHYRRVEFVIPDAAMSAGTILVMSGDAIHMDYYSNLGPIDPQMPSQDGTSYVPALGYLKKFEQLMVKAAAGGLTQAETTYLCTKFDPAELYRYEHAREMSIALLEEWLAKYKFRNWKKTEKRGLKVTPAMRRRRAKEIAEILNDTERWHTHGHGISIAVVRRTLKLRIEDFGRNKKLQTQIRGYWALLDDFTSKLGQRGVIHLRGNYKPLYW